MSWQKLLGFRSYLINLNLFSGFASGIFEKILGAGHAQLLTSQYKSLVVCDPLRRFSQICRMQNLNSEHQYVISFFEISYNERTLAWNQKSSKVVTSSRFPTETIFLVQRCVLPCRVCLFNFVWFWDSLWYVRKLSRSYLFIKMRQSTTEHQLTKIFSDHNKITYDSCHHTVLKFPFENYKLTILSNWD